MSASLSNNEQTSFGDTSRAGQASGLVGNLVNLVSGKGNSLTANPSTSATGSDSKIMLYVLGAAVAVGLIAFLILRRK